MKEGKWEGKMRNGEETEEKAISWEESGESGGPEGNEQTEMMEGNEQTGMPDGYEDAGTLEGYQVFVCYASEGPDREEAMALYQEAKNSVLFQNLAAMGGDTRQ